MCVAMPFGEGMKKCFEKGGPSTEMSTQIPWRAEKGVEGGGVLGEWHSAFPPLTHPCPTSWIHSLHADTHKAVLGYTEGNINFPRNSKIFDPGNNLNCN